MVLPWYSLSFMVLLPENPASVLVGAFAPQTGLCLQRGDNSLRLAWRDTQLCGKTRCREPRILQERFHGQLFVATECRFALYSIIYYDIYYVIYYDTAFVYTDIMSVQIAYRLGILRAIFIPNAEIAVSQFKLMSEQQHLEELLERKLCLLDVQLRVLIICPDKRVPEIP